MTTTWHECPLCREWDFATHRCKPLWRWRVVSEPAMVDADGKEHYDWAEVRAWDADQAAERAAEQYDQDGDYSLSRGNEVVIELRSPDGDVARFRCSAEAVPQYRVSEV